MNQLVGKTHMVVKNFTYILGLIGLNEKGGLMTGVQ